ncbi:uncharacterized protein LOC105643399 [Jatropha curcas]|uniref:uncharacterized protein LOC105643399 n=1 Tax=Jatropha curcas TaxID=180498 RepID=UPI001894DEF8|nr:uncharacterized protein LOC105643399 [Jatropha curcas]
MACGLAILWHSQVHLEVIRYSSHFIDMKIREAQGFIWRLTGFYGMPERSRRQISWNVLRSLAGLEHLPWLICGDFNDLMFAAEKKGRHPHPPCLLQGFSDTVADCGLVDLGMTGYPFTWAHGRGQHRVEERLDRALGNITWQNHFPNYLVQNLVSSRSDHSPLLIITSPRIENRRTSTFSGKIKVCGERLQSWGRRLKLRFRQDAKKLTVQLENLRISGNNEQFEAVQRMLDDVLHREEVFWSQRAKSHWLQSGDINSRYFHATAKKRKKSKQIFRLKDANGEWISDNNLLKGMVSDYFVNLFEAGDVDLRPVVGLFSPLVSDNDNSRLLGGIMTILVYLEIFRWMRFWDVVGHDVVTSFRDWFNTGVFPNNLNDTLIVLIPKVEDPEAVKDFRPISLCNVVYKVFAKGLGFSQRWVDLIMLCVSSVKYWIGVNGDEVGPIILERGLRQGCPLSPYLFILCAEGLSKLFYQSEREGRLKGCRVSRAAPRLSHLLFADDSLFFFEASRTQALEIKTILVTYEAASGQAVNWQKSGIFFSSNTSEMDKTAVQGVFGVIAPLNHGRYLGLPSLIGRDRRHIFSFLKDRVRKLVSGWNQKLLSKGGKEVLIKAVAQAIPSFCSGWNQKLLSKGGKEVLIKAVAQAIPSFCMSSFLLPVSILTELQRLMNSYWWGGKMRWLSWERLCVAKEEGGLGFRHLRSFNLALLGKHCWRLLHNTNSLFYSSFKSKYFPSGDFLGTGVGRNPSFVWRGICAAKDAICSGFRWRIGDGQSVNVWTEPWLLRDNQFRVHLPILPVRALEFARAWNLPLIHGLFNPSIADIITSIPLATNVQDDILIWHWTDSGIYSVKSGYRLVASQYVDPEAVWRSSFWKILWSLKIPPKVRHFLWRCCRDILPVKATLARRGLELDIGCDYCGNTETLVHTLVECPRVSFCWQFFGIQLPTGNIPTFLQLLEHLHKLWENEFFESFVMGLWSVWSSRNELKWNVMS